MTTYRSPIRRVAAGAAVTTAVVVLAACGSNGDSSAGHGGHSESSQATTSAPTAQGQHNAADVSFAQGMIPHHRQAVQMADLAATRASSPEVEKLAGEIKKAQGPEIETLSGWLTSWGEEAPAADEGSGHTGHSMSGSGMMTADEMKELEGSSGKAFDTAFLRMMIEHHEGAVEMAEAERADGAYRPAKDMADDIVTSQTAEITRMNTLLGKG